MLRDITLGQYFPGDSFLYKMDPRMKILLTIVYLVLIFTVKNYAGYAAVLLLLIITVKSTDIPFGYILKGIKPIMVFIVFTAVLNLFMTGGDVIWKWGFLRVTRQGINYAVFMIVRIVLLMAGTSMLTYTTSPITLTDGIERLLSPFSKVGLPAHELAMMMTIALRFIPTLIEETDKIMKAQSARGADFETGNIVHRAKSLVPLLVPLFISAFRRADELATAMECRCYRGGENRTRMHVLKMTGVDIAAACIMLAFCAAVITLNIYFGSVL